MKRLRLESPGMHLFSWPQKTIIKPLELYTSCPERVESGQHQHWCRPSPIVDLLTRCGASEQKSWKPTDHQINSSFFNHQIVQLHSTIKFATSNYVSRYQSWKKIYSFNKTSNFVLVSTRLAIAPFVAIGCRRAAQCRLHAFHEARLDVQEVWVKDHPEIIRNL